MPSVPQIECVF